MKIKSILGVAIASLTSLAQIPLPVRAELIPLGKASGGQTIRIDSASIQGNGGMGSWWQSFVYYLGNERIQASAHCGRGIWEVDGKEYKPQSKATKDMISIVCSAHSLRSDVEDMGRSLIFDPPSNIRKSPNGPVLCTITEKTVIQVYAEPRGEWYSTSACGGNGWIHSSQIRPF